MTDQELVDDMRLTAIGKHLRAAGRLIDAMSNESGRRLQLFVASGSPELMYDTENASDEVFKRQITLLKTIRKNIREEKIK